MSAQDFISNDEHRYRSGDLRSFTYLLRFAKPWYPQIVISLLLLSCASLLGVFSARGLGELVQKGLVLKNKTDAIKIGAFVIALELFSVLLVFWGRRLMAACASTTILAIRQKLFARLRELPMRYFDRQPLGRTVTRMTYDVEGLEEFFSGTLSRVLSAALSVVIVVGAMLSTDFKLGALLVCAIIPAVVVTYLFREPVRVWNREFAIRNSAINAKLSEFLSGIPVIRAFGAEDWSLTKFDGVVNHHLEAAIKINVINSWVRPLVLILCHLPLICLLWFGGHSVVGGTLSLGLFVTFVRLCERFSRPISALAQEIHTIQAAFTSAERITNFLREPDENTVLGPDGSQEPRELRGEIVFDRVNMSYDDKTPVLKDVSFHLPAGKRFGVAGTTGSGKTTTVALLSRLYPYQSGKITIDGIPVEEFRRAKLRDKIGFVSQDVVLFKGSLRENLSSGRELGDAEIMSAAERTGLLKIMSYSQRNLDSHILDQGMNLSVGERQLVALTRVLLKNPLILIMDEATSNIDPYMERIVHEAVDTVMKDRTCLIIAHRLSTLHSCDQILVFRDGQIIESGTHEGLYEQKGYYAELLKQSYGLGGDNANNQLPHT